MTGKNNLDAIILCGGLGTRFQKVMDDRPKVMALVNNQPFLDFVIEKFLRFGLKRLILCIGYMSEYIKNYYQTSPYFPYLVFSEEIEPLSTGGAIKYAQGHIRSQNFFVVNGDSYCDADLESFLSFHLTKPDALISILLVPQDGRKDTGFVVLDDQTSFITAFNEKQRNQNSYINSGVYIFNKEALSLIPKNQKVSLEYDVFPKLAGKNLYGFPTKSRVIDIGTPERYQKALEYFKFLNQNH